MQIFSANTSESEPPNHGCVVGEDKHLAPEDRPVTGDDGVAVGAAFAHAELNLAVAHVAIELHERPLVQEPLQPLPREQLALRSVTLDPHLAGVPAWEGLLEPATRAGARAFAATLRGRPALLRRHGSPGIRRRSDTGARFAG